MLCKIRFVNKQQQKKKPKRQGHRWGLAFRVPVSVDNGVLRVCSLVFYVDPT